MNIAKLLEEDCRKYPKHTAIIFEGQKISFSQLRDSVFKLADGLSKLKVNSGTKVAIYLPNAIEYIYSYLAIWCCGATVVPLDFMLTEDELVSCMSHCEAALLITKNKPTVSFSNLRKGCPALKIIITCQDRVPDCLSFEQVLSDAEDKIPHLEINDKDHAIIFYTSGTTGRPKGVLVNYGQLAAPAQAMKYFSNLTDKDITICALPLSHLGGLVFIYSLVFLGPTVVLMQRFIPLEFIKNVQEYKVNCFWLVPPMYYALLQLKEFETFDLSSLNWVVVFGASSSPDMLRRFHKFCPHAKFMNGWGMTETNAPSIVLPMDSEKIESVGKPLPWLEVKIFDDHDREMKQGQIGEIVVKGWVVSEGYYQDPRATQEAMRSGWFHTGDLGRFDNDGFLYIAGRKKEMIKVGGGIVFEPEVEAAILRHSEVAEVAVIGVADKLRGELPKAFVVLREGSSLSAEDLRFFCRQHLAHFKIPHYFEFRSALPKNRSGKVDKEGLRKESLINA